MAGYDAIIKALLTVDDKASPQLKNFEKNIGSVTKTIGSMAKGLAAGFTAGAFVGLIKASIDAADEIGKLSQKIGVSVEDLSSLKYAAQLSDVGLDQLKTSFKELNQSIVESQDSTKDSSKIFKGLGISTEDASGKLKDSKQVMYELADSFAGLEDDAAKSELAVKLFGKAGLDMIPLLNQGSAAIKEQEEEARKLGLVLSKDMTDAAQNFNDSMTTLYGAVGGVFSSLAQELLPVLQVTTKGMIDSAKEGSNLKLAFDALNVTLKALIITGAFIGRIFTGLGKVIGGTAAVAVAALKGNFKEAKAIYDQMGKDNASDAANFRKFASDVWNATTATKENTKATEVNNNSKKSASGILKTLSGDTKNVDAEQRKLNKTFDDAVISLTRERDSVGELSKEEQMRFETTIGKYKELGVEQKKILIGLGLEIDKVQTLKAIYGSYVTELRAFNETVSLGTTTAEFDTEYMKKLVEGYKTGVIKVNEQLSLDMNDKAVQYLETTKEIEGAYAIRLIQLEKLIGFEQAVIDKANISKNLQTEGWQAEQEQAKAAQEKLLVYQGQKQALEEILSKYKDLTIQERMSVNANKEIAQELEFYKGAWDEVNNSIKSARESAKKHVYQMELLNKWLDENKISLEEYDRESQKIIDASNTFTEQQEKQTDEITEFWKKAAQSMQSSMSDFFFGIMQGEMDDLATNFKKTIDRMVADLLASQLATYLFGDSFGKGGNIGGLVGSFFGGFRAAGGDVSGGTSYIVGEKGPELFTPKASGTIIPNNAMASNVNINIQSLDGADTMRVLNKNRREIAEMVMGTRMAYNMR